MTCCSRCSRSTKRGPHSVATHYVLHFDSVVELHPIDDLREPFEPAQSSPAALGAQAELVDHREHSVAGQTSLSCDRSGGARWRSSTRSRSSCGCGSQSPARYDHCWRSRTPVPSRSVESANVRFRRARQAAPGRTRPSFIPNADIARNVCYLRTHQSQIGQHRSVSVASQVPRKQSFVAFASDPRPVAESDSLHP